MDKISSWLVNSDSRDGAEVDWTILELSTDFTNPMGEVNGVIEALIGLFVLNVDGRVYFSVVLTLWDTVTALRSMVVPVIEFGILSESVISTLLVTEKPS